MESDYYIFILISMIFLHILEDFHLQGILASMKQKSWWEKQEGYSLKYSADYIMAMLMHGFSWTFLVMLPIFIIQKLQVDIPMYFIFLINWLIHCFVDDLKANRKKINLVEDQFIHFVQIVVIWSLFVWG